MNKKITLLVLLVFSLTVSYAQNSPSLAQALTKAKKENKLVFIDCYFTGCIPCEQMDKDVFPNAAVGKALERDFITLKVNVFTEKLGDTLKVQHILNGFPTFLVLNGDGKLLVNTSGYQDPGDLIQLLNDAKAKYKKGAYLSGYAAQYNDRHYPTIYTEFAKTRKGLTKETLATYSASVKDFKANYALLPFLIARTTNEQVSSEILRDYAGYAAVYGVEVLQPVIDRILQQAVDRSLKATSSEAEFENFLTEKARLFTSKEWKVSLQTIGERYFLGLKKDTTGYLKFRVKNPTINNFHLTALYNNMLVKKQLNSERLALFAAWANGAVTPNTTMEIIKAAANISKAAGSLADHKKFLQMAIDKAKKYQMPYAELEAQLNKAS
ncbi:thioredoxin family protein [Pedobacter insulae]|uniref:Thioredoxin-related protein n=1 Tax=Pedobacter insulae TaxID=414048 RepID=A0A1I2VSL6_9SPHI|nr:thioredoxin family protein [Pedobacter insulae]SFG92140.1 Thioredoxin-related protein [Pedobacter insulae]